MTQQPTRTRALSDKDHVIAKLSALAIGLSLIDNSIPSFVPGIKPGFANIMILFAWEEEGLAIAAWVSVLRVFCASLIFGYFGTPTFLMSISGALFSIAGLGLCTALPRQFFSLISTSLVCALLHYAGQIMAVYFFLIPSTSIFKIIPILGLSAIITGYVNGASARYLVKKSRDKDCEPDLGTQ